MTSLRDLAVCVVDCQTTGSSSEHANILEVGWGAYRASQPPQSFRSEALKTRLVPLPNGESIPRRVAQMTGIEEDDLADASSPNSTRDAMRESLPDAGIWVAHYARFERRFLEPFLATDGTDHPWLCTHGIAARLYPGLPRRGLRAMAGYFGHCVPEEKRAEHHAFATALIWRHLIDEARHREGIETLHQLQTWLSDTPEERPDTLSYSMDRERRLGLPDSPGTYTFLTSNDDPLYVGKASDLKRRVNSYFQSRRGLSSRKLEMVTQVDDVRVEPAETALEAALLESDRIKEMSPPYNRALRRRQRTLRWLSDDASHVAQAPDASHPFGPLTSTATARFLSALRTSLRRQEPTTGLLRSHQYDPETVAAVLEPIFEHGLDMPADIDGLRRRGICLWEEKLLKEAEEELDADPGEETSEEMQDLTPERAIERLESRLRHATRRIRKGRWMQALLDAQIAWRPTHSMLTDEDSAYRVLRFSGGDIVMARWASEAVVGELLSSHAADTSDPSTDAWDIDTYDRLSILVSEIRRLLRDGSDGANLRLHTSAGVRYDADALGTVLRWV